MDYINMNYFYVILALLDEKYSLDYVGISLSYEEKMVLRVLDNFIDGFIKNIEDIKDECEKEVVEEYKIDKNVLISLRRNYNNLVNIYEELQII